jgi:hypothetical protein
VKPDPFSRSSDHEPADIVLAPMILAQNGVDDMTLDLIKDAYSVDPYYMDRTHSRVTWLQHENGLHYYASWLCIPDDTRIRTLLLKEAHEPTYSFHQAIARTLANLSRFAWWPLLSCDIKSYVNACLTCKATTAFFMLPFLDTMVYPNHLFPTKTQSLQRIYGTSFLHLLGTKTNLMTTFEPQQIEQSEFMGQVITSLRSFMTPHHSDWDKYMINAEFSLNIHESATGHTQYSLLYNQHAHIPDTIVTPLTDNDVPGDVTAYIGRWQTNMDAARTILAHGEPMHT